VIRINSSCKPVVLFLGAEEIGSPVHTPLYCCMEMQRVFSGDGFPFPLNVELRQGNLRKIKQNHY